MKTEKRTIDGRDFWFTAKHVCKEDLNTGDYLPTGRYYCAFSAREPGPHFQGEVLKDDRGRARLFDAPDQALAAGVREVEARLDLPAKAYAVGLPYGNKDSEFEVYTRLLQTQGIDPDKPQVDDSYGRKWLHVWATREDAERFADLLRRESRNRDWEVYELSPPRPPGGPDATHGPVEILIGRQSDGTTYSLHPNSFKRIRKRFPAVHPRPSIFLGRDSRAAYEASNGSSYDQIAGLLTGLSPRQFAELGGYRIVDPLTGLVLHGANVAAEPVRG